jgi:hypothetical protein
VASEWSEREFCTSFTPSRAYRAENGSPGRATARRVMTKKFEICHWSAFAKAAVEMRLICRGGEPISAKACDSLRISSRHLSITVITRRAA